MVGLLVSLLVVGQADASRPQDRCELARQQLVQLEQALREQQASAEEERQRQAQACQALLNTHGQGAWASCQASRSEPGVDASLQEQVEAAREALRRAQIGGCR